MGWLPQPVNADMGLGLCAKGSLAAGDGDRKHKPPFYEAHPAWNRGASGSPPPGGTPGSSAQCFSPQRPGPTPPRHPGVQGTAVRLRQALPHRSATFCTSACSAARVGGESRERQLSTGQTATVGGDSGRLLPAPSGAQPQPSPIGASGYLCAMDQRDTLTKFAMAGTLIAVTCRATLSASFASLSSFTSPRRLESPIPDRSCSLPRRDIPPTEWAYTAVRFKS
jgi:hypothetical protein